MVAWECPLGLGLCLLLFEQVANANGFLVHVTLAVFLGHLWAWQVLVVFPAPLHTSSLNLVLAGVIGVVGFV